MTLPRDFWKETSEPHRLFYDLFKSTPLFAFYYNYLGRTSQKSPF